ncbi:MAG: protoporphyrinogen oxidase HemJ [Rhodospirillales bacterium]|nr:protoporphyrinogen oxidase HemJ [Rhodospirillales bacterium]
MSATVYLLIKAFHIIAVISWMAGLLYLPRLFIYHCEAVPGSEKSETFKVMERRLYRAIMNPARIVALVLGVLLIIELSPDIWSEIWFQVKLVCLVVLMAMHDLMGKWRKAFEADCNTKSQKFFRYMNEVPTLLMIVIVIMVVMKPL